ncbi:MAG: hypothetical protein HY902_20105 [Deltaproteobacteria bacterium]|nr:hypothetical protein [Deltaproteobacteria bacterium]
MSGEAWIWRGLALLAAVLLAAAARTGQRRLALAAAVVAFGAGLGHVAAPGAGLVLAGVALGSGLALWNGRAAGWPAWAGVAAAAALAVANPAPVLLATQFAPLGGAGLLLLALGWQAIGVASAAPLGRVALVLLLLFLPWGPDDVPVALWRAPILRTLSGSTAAAAVAGVAWTRHPGDLWAHWPNLLLVGGGAWLAAWAALSGATQRWRGATGVAVLGAAALALAWQSDSAPALPNGVVAIQDAVWQADFGLFALAAWRWLAVLAVVLRGRDGPVPEAAPAWDAAVPALAGLTIAALALATGDAAAVSLPRDPAIWSLAAVLLAGSAHLAAGKDAPRWAGLAVLVQWLAAAGLCSGAAGGWSLAGLFG